MAIRLSIIAGEARLVCKRCLRRLIKPNVFVGVADGGKVALEVLKGDADES